MKNKKLPTALIFWSLASLLQAGNKSQMSIYLGTGSSSIKARAFIVDPQGHRLGHDPVTHTFLHEIPDFGYDSSSLGADDGSGRSLPEAEQFLIQPILTGVYTITVYALESSTFSLTILSNDVNHRRFTPLIIKGSLIGNPINTYKLLTDTAPNSTGSVIHSSFFDSAPFAAQTAGACSGMTLSVNGKIIGAARSGDTLTLSGNALVIGNATAANITSSGNGRVQGTITKSTAPFDCIPVDLSGIQQDFQKANDNAKLPTASLKNGVFSAKGDDKVKIPAGNYLLDGLTVTGNAKVTTSGAVHILVRSGMVNISGNGSISSVPASALMVFSNSTGTLGVAGNGQVAGVFYFPRGTVKVEGNGKIAGSVFGRTVEVTNDAQITAQ